MLSNPSGCRGERETVDSRMEGPVGWGYAQWRGGLKKAVSVVSGLSNSNMTKDDIN